MPLFTSTTLTAVTVSSKEQIPCTCANWVNHLEDYFIWHPILKLAKANTVTILYNYLQIACEQCHYIVWLIAGIMPCPQLKHITNVHVCTKPFPDVYSIM